MNKLLPFFVTEVVIYLVSVLGLGLPTTNLTPTIYFPGVTIVILEVVAVTP